MTNVSKQLNRPGRHVTMAEKALPVADLLQTYADEGQKFATRVLLKALGISTATLNYFTMAAGQSHEEKILRLVAIGGSMLLVCAGGSITKADDASERVLEVLRTDAGKRPVSLPEALAYGA